MNNSALTPTGITINGEPLPREAIEYEEQRLRRFYSEHMNETVIKEQRVELMRKAVDQAIGAKLLMNEAMRLDLKVPEDLVEKRLAELMQQAGGEKNFMTLLQRENVTVDTIKEGIRQGGKVDVLVEQIVQDAVEPTAAEIREYFDSHKDDFKKPERVAVQHILKTVEADDDQSQKATACSLLYEIRERVAEGADFAEQAAAHSDCPSGQKSGGSLGWFARGAILPVLNDAVFAMEVDELSDVIESPLGLHLLRKTGYEEGGPAVFEEVQENVRDLLRHMRRGEVLRAYVEDLQKKSVISGVDKFVAMFDSE